MSTARLLRLEWLIVERGFIKIFSSKTSSGWSAAQSDVERLWGYANCTSGGEFHSVFSTTSPRTRLERLRKWETDFPAFSYSCCVLEFRSVSALSSLFSSSLDRKPDPIQLRRLSLVRFEPRAFVSFGRNNPLHLRLGKICEKMFTTCWKVTL